jgi:hypothetical protein
VKVGTKIPKGDISAGSSDIGGGGGGGGDKDKKGKGETSKRGKKAKEIEHGKRPDKKGLE